MAHKTSAKQGSSDEQERGAPRVSRKVIGKGSAPYERKTGAEGGEEKKPGSDGEQAAAAEGGAVESTPAADAAISEAAADPGKSEPIRASARKEPGARREAKTTDRVEPAPAEEPAAGATEAQATATDAAEAAPAAPAPAAPQADPEDELEALLRPRDIQPGDPDAPAPPPRKAPPGDSRSFRRYQDGAEEFVLIYRSGSFLIRRAGRVGVMGTWTVTEYPHIGAAAHAYAQQCSDLVHAGFRDLR